MQAQIHVSQAPTHIDRYAKENFEEMLRKNTQCKSSL